MGLKWVRDDGGRAAAGFNGMAPGDCVCRAISIALGGGSETYKFVYMELNDAGKTEKKLRGATRRSSARTGVYRQTSHSFILSLGFKWTPTMKIGSGCRVHLAARQLPKGIIIVKLSKHLACVIDGVLHDLSDCSRGGQRCVYGYYQMEARTA